MERQTEPKTQGIVSFPAVIARTAWFLALWFALSGFDYADLPAAVIAVAFATWASLRLLPPGGARPSPILLARLLLRFMRQSLVAGLDVAWRALSPALPLRPGFIQYKPRLPQGPAQNAYCTLMSLLPGSLPAWQEPGGALTIHCLDVGQPVAAQMDEEEKLFVRALGLDAGND